jgi:hypothetical protein
MKITQQKLREWFPANNRFLHFCAKHYGYTFYNDEVVEDAKFFSLKNVMKMYNEGKEFGDEAEMTGMVMSSFRFGILAAYNTQNRRLKNKIQTESDLLYGDGAEEYNKFQQLLESEDKEYDNLPQILHEFIETELTWVEKLVIKQNILEGETYNFISRKYDVSNTSLRSARERALNKLRKYVKATTQPSTKRSSSAYNDRYISPNYSKLRIEAQLESVRKEQEESDRYISAMSYVYLD